MPIQKFANKYIKFLYINQKWLSQTCQTLIRKGRSSVHISYLAYKHPINNHWRLLEYDKGHRISWIWEIKFLVSSLSPFWFIISLFLFLFFIFLLFMFQRANGFQVVAYLSHCHLSFPQKTPLSDLCVWKCLPLLFSRQATQSRQQHSNIIWLVRRK